MNDSVAYLVHTRRANLHFRPSIVKSFSSPHEIFSRARKFSHLKSTSLESRDVALRNILVVRVTIVSGNRPSTTLWLVCESVSTLEATIKYHRCGIRLRAWAQEKLLFGRGRRKIITRLISNIQFSQGSYILPSISF